MGSAKTPEDVSTDFSLGDKTQETSEMKTCWPCQLLSTILVLSFFLTTLGVDDPSVPKAILRASGCSRAI